MRDDDPGLQAAVFAWEDGLARLAAPDPLGRVRRRIVATVEQELRRRVGTEFTRRELASAYEDASSWYLDLAAAVAPKEPAAWDPAIALDAAFGAYARRAADAKRP